MKMRTLAVVAKHYTDYNLPNIIKLLHVSIRFYQDCELIVAHNSRLIFLVCDDSRVKGIFSLLHFFLDIGNLKKRVRRGGYVMVTSPFWSGSVAYGYPNGYVGFCHRNVGWIFCAFIFQKLFWRVQPAPSRGKNSRWALGLVPGHPACTKSPRISSMFFAPNLCSKP